MNAVRNLQVDRGPIEQEFKYAKDGAEKKRLWALASERKRENVDEPFQYPLMDCYSDDVLAQGVEYALAQLKRISMSLRHSKTKPTPL